ncbi:DUF1080 domain-containing protein [bacterium]|nr:DUF1080 domain-containing protein [bacterium]
MTSFNRHLRSFSSFLCISLQITSSAAEEATPLFDGKTLSGWQTEEADPAVWRVENGSIIAESGGKKMSQSSYLFSEKKYDHFEFRCQFKLTGDPKTGLINSGIQFRSRNDDGQAAGYQADIGDPDSWGSIFEEQGRGLLAKANMKKVLPIIKKDDWNDYLIRANGPRIQLWINGLETANYLETKPQVPYDGYFALELKAGGNSRVEFKNITLKELDGGLDPADTKAWWADKARIAYQQLNVSKIPQTPEDQLQTFELADGFVAELVASESEGIGKFVAVEFDNQGRMWSMTALDYPVDAKREKAKAENLFKTGGSDKLLVFDTPTAAGVQKPRIFAEGLAIPLGIMPYKKGAIAQYGPDIRYYQDTDGDGKADSHEAILTGFGIEDSHLFPHQFTRGPGGWMYLNQGLGNFSKVRRPDGSAFANGAKSYKLDRCRVARMKLDGSDFQNTTTGPNNAWGFLQGRDGEWFIQEANDKGYPVAKYDFGVYLNTGGTPKIKSYQPILPPIFDTAIMGGTGLSGLALAEDRNSPFAKEGLKTFYLANPLTSSIQIVTAKALGNNRYEWKKQKDFLVSGDKWFRPVGIKFGPDGALYIVDWYNKIISHGEVSQTHPERDKTRGRIWRIRHKDQARPTPPNLAKATNPELLEHLRNDNALIQRHSWLEITDRKATDLLPQLKSLIVDQTEALDIRLAALWAAEELGGADSSLLSAIATDKEANLRAEVIRIAGRKSDDTGFATLAKTAANDPAVRVRYALGEALVSRLNANADAMHAAALLGKSALNDADRLTKYEREFERFLARWAMEEHPDATAEMLSQVADLPVENRLLAMQSLKPEQAALAFLPMIPKLDRDLTTIELSLITSQLNQPKVNAGFKALLNDPARQQSMLRALSQADPETSNPLLNDLLVEACRQLIKRDDSPTNQTIVMQTAQRHRLKPLQADIGAWLLKATDLDTITAGLRCLRELGPVDAQLCQKFIAHENESIKQEAIIALSTATGTDTISALADQWSNLSATAKQSTIDGLINSPAKAEAFAQAILAGKFEGIDSGSIERLIIVLGDQPSAKELLEKLGDSVPMVIRLNGGTVDSKITLKGPFTLEGWVRLTGKGGLSTPLLSSKNGTLSFNKGKLSLSGTGRKGRNLVVAKTTATLGQWTHYALTRDQNGICRIYLDGVLDATGKRSYNGNFTDLNFTSPPKAQSQKELMAFRVWDTDLDTTAIYEGLKVSYATGELPKGLLKRISGDVENLPLKGKASISPASNAPALITSAEAAKLAETFTKYEAMIKATGNTANGKLMFQQACVACHMVNSVGGNIGPDLSGAGVMGDTALLRNILTPNASLEASYYRHDLKLRDGSFISGFMANETDKTITIRLIGADDRVIKKSNIQSHSISKRSLMPEGLMNGMKDQDVADLFEYLRTLK